MFTKTQTRLFSQLSMAHLTGALLLSACAPAALEANLATDPRVATAENPAAILLPAAADPATEALATEVPAAQPPANTGTTVTFGPLTLVVPEEVAVGASGIEVPGLDSEDAAWWQKTPGHLQVMLGDYYVLQGKVHQPQITVYPAQAYAEMVPAAFESIRRLNNILYDSGASIGGEQLPAVPFFNAQQLFAANIQAISFQNGGGVRFLTEYAQYNAPVNNHELFYQFQGVTRDGAYYIVAVFPITAPMLAETGEESAVVPPGGVAYPGIAEPNADWQGYYTAASDLLNGASADSFRPSINQLDALIASMQIAP